MGRVAKVFTVCAWCNKSREPAEPNHWLPADTKAADAETLQTHEICPASHKEQVSLVDAVRASQRLR